MPRKAPEVHKHTCPENAGRQNLDPILDTLPKDEDGLMKKILPIYKHADYIRSTYKGLWTEETFKASIAEFFDYCASVELKPTKSGLQLWLGSSRDQYNDWERFPEKHGFKTDMIRDANASIETFLQGRVDKYPTGNIFLLKAMHGYKDATNIDVTSHNASQDDIQEALKRLGLVEKETD